MARPVSPADPHGLSAQSLARALRHVPGCERGEAHSARSLAGGSINQTLRIDSARGRFVVRFAGEEGGSLGVDRRREIRLQSIAAAAGIAPRILFAEADASFLVMEWIDGRVWDCSDVGNVAQLDRLAARLKELHALPTGAVSSAPRTFDPLAEARRLSARITSHAPEEAALIERLVERAVRAADDAAGGARADAIVHNDLHFANVIEADRLLLLDWEYAHVADPLLDLASLLSYNPQVRAHAARLLAGCGLSGSVSSGNLQALVWLFDLINYLWYRVHRLQGSPSAAERAAETAVLGRLMAS